MGPRPGSGAAGGVIVAAVVAKRTATAAVGGGRPFGAGAGPVDVTAAR